MENAYVGNDVSAENAKTTVGSIVIQAVEDKYKNNNKIGNATIDVEVTKDKDTISDNATISVSTTDFVVEGTITIQDGVLSWGEIQPNVPRISGVPETLSLDTSSNYTINAKLKGTSGNINWSSSNSAIASVSNGVITTATSITNSTEQVTITASADGCESKTCTLTVTKAMPYAKDVLLLTNNNSPYVYYYAKNGSEENKIECSVLYNDAEHGLQIISVNPIRTVTLGKTDPTITDTTNVIEIAQTSYNNAIITLNNYAEDYINNANDIATDARCVGSLATVNNKEYDKKDKALDENNNEVGLFQSGYTKMSNILYNTDHNLQSDLNQLKNLNLLAYKDTTYGGNYFMASRYVRNQNSDAYFKINVGTYNNPYGINPNQAPDIATFISGYMWRADDVITKGFRPVFLINPTAKIKSGTGTEADPYILETGE